MKEDVLPELGVGVTKTAAQLGVTRAAHSHIVNGRAATSADIALPGAWMNGRGRYNDYPN
ncbi:helix-turn-helix transcriptional regulator [Methylomonas sp. LL1]|uniref:helix-turn-helix transcriptional regulator n=1 Tax=Methylomonas sp. LL1 TaxID=2785785 RepID=UPI001E32D902|nr:hypothetical protein [Methylomonas sp. LL1]